MTSLLLPCFPFVIGLLLAVIAVLGRQERIAPRCRACRYPVAGLVDSSATRCPECGADLTKSEAVQRFRRSSPRRLVVLASMFLLIALVLASHHVARTSYGFDWIVLRPTSWLVADVEQNVDNHSAWRELTRRIVRGTVPTATEAELFAMIIAEIQGRNPIQAFGGDPWRQALLKLLDDQSDDPLARWTEFDASFPVPALGVDQTRSAPMGDQAYFNLSFDLVYPEGVDPEFRVLGVRAVRPDAPIFAVHPLGSSSGGGGAVPMVRTRSGFIGFRFAPVHGPGEVAYTLLVEERRVVAPDGVGSRIGFKRPMGDSDRSGPIVEADLDGPSQFLVGSQWIHDDELEAIGEPLRAVVHEIPFTVDVEPPRVTGAVHPALFGGLDNFEILAVRAVRRGPPNTTVVALHLDIRGPRDLPVGYSASLRRTPMDSIPAGTFMIDPSEIDDPTATRTITLAVQEDIPLSQNRVTVILSPAWATAQRQRPDWTRIWGGEFIFRNVLIEGATD